MTHRLHPPAPPKKSRRRRGDGDDKERASYRKHIKRLFRKVRRHIGDDARDDRPTIDSDWWHWHHQSMTDAAHEHDRSSHQHRPHYPSPTL